MKRWSFYFEEPQESSIKSVFFWFVNAKTCLATENEVMWRAPWEINWKCTILRKIPAERWKTAYQTTKSSPSLPISTLLHAFCHSNMAARQSFIVPHHLSMPIRMKDGFSWPPLSSPCSALAFTARPITLRQAATCCSPTAGNNRDRRAKMAANHPPSPPGPFLGGQGHIGPANLNARLPQQIGQFT